jgi:DNA-binding transcriptional LysR family regulator
VVGHTGTHLTALSARQLDVAFVLSGSRSERAGRFRPLHPERFLVAMPNEHSLARLRAVRVEHLAREPIVLFPRTLDPALHDHLVVDVCGRAGVSLSVMLEATTLESSLGAVADGLGLAFTAESVVDLITVRGITFRPLVATVPALQVGVAWRRDATSKAVQQFLVIVDELARGPRVPNRNGRADRHNGHRQGKARVTSS